MWMWWEEGRKRMRGKENRRGRQKWGWGSSGRRWWRTKRNRRRRRRR